MRVPLLSLVLCSAVLGKPCFDFSKPVSEPLHGPISLTGGAMVSRRGEEGWAAARGIIPGEPVRLYRWLLDHGNWKDTSRTKLEVREERRPHYADFHVVGVELKVFAFITVSWVEEWAYRILEGGKEAPVVFLVSYQKTEGTGQLKELCGSVLARKVPSGTDVFFYERARSRHYSARDIEKMHLDNLRELGAPAP